MLSVYIIGWKYTTYSYILFLETTKNLLKDAFVIEKDINMDDTTIKLKKNGDIHG